jgi:hypothetical protein
MTSSSVHAVGFTKQVAFESWMRLSLSLAGFCSIYGVEHTKAVYNVVGNADLVAMT